MDKATIFLITFKQYMYLYISIFFGVGISSKETPREGRGVVLGPLGGRCPGGRSGRRSSLSSHCRSVPPHSAHTHTIRFKLFERAF